MEDQFNLTVTPTDKGEVIIRHGKAPDIKQRQQINIKSCDINAPAKYWDAKKELYEASMCIVKFSKRFGNIVLLLPYGEEEQLDEIIGTLQENDELVKLEINKGQYKTFQEMHEKLRWMRNIFVDNTQYINIIGKLQNFRAKIDTEIEKIKDEKGNSVDMVVTKVMNDIPLEFQLKTNIFYGQPEKIFTVNIIVKASGTQLLFTLESMELYEMMQKEKDEAIAAGLAGLTEIVQLEIA